MALARRPALPGAVLLRARPPAAKVCAAALRRHTAPAADGKWRSDGGGGKKRRRLRFTSC
jgi:hypothetical protein